MHEFDIVVWATGFDFGTGALTRMGIRGRNGLALDEYWADGPKTFLGVQSAGFPNFFFPGGPHAAAGNNPRYNGDQVDFITDTLVYAREHGYETIEVDPAAEERWTTMVDTGAASSPFGESSYFFGTQHPGEAAQVPLELGRPPEALQGDRTGDRRRLQGVQTVATGVSGPPTAPGNRSGGAVSRNRLRLCARSQVASSCEVPHLPERDTELEKTEVVDRQQRMPALVALPRRPFPRPRSCRRRARRSATP